MVMSAKCCCSTFTAFFHGGFKGVQRNNSLLNLMDSLPYGLSCPFISPPSFLKQSLPPDSLILVIILECTAPP